MISDWIKNQEDVYASEDKNKYPNNSLPFGEAQRGITPGNPKEWMVKLLLSYLNKGMKVLDVGANDGGLVEFLVNKGVNAWGIDLPKIIAKTRIKRSKMSGRFSVCDVNKDFPIKMFDVIYASSVIEHLYDDFTFLKNCYLHLNDFGKLILVFPENGIDHIAHLREYSKESMIKLLELFGFKMVYYMNHESNQFIVGEKINQSISKQFTEEEWELRQKYEISTWKHADAKEIQKHKVKVFKKFNTFPRQSFKNKILVDVGSGPQGWMEKLDAKMKIGLDPLMDKYDDEGWKIKEKNYLHLISEGEKIPILTGYANVVFCFNALSHTNDPIKVIKEIHRILDDKDGLFFFYHNLSDITNDFHLSYKLEKYQDIINKQGFKTIFRQEKEIEGQLYYFMIFKKQKKEEDKDGQKKLDK